jgi:hypothetical protein
MPSAAPVTTTTLPFKENCSKTLSGIKGTGLGNPSRMILESAADMDIVSNNLVYDVFGIRKTEEIPVAMVKWKDREHYEEYFSHACCATPY